uniref:CD276 antigen-like n=1 Tax=Lepisosteus oculatus TaxID=7918 RepID=W5M2N1_LEPOC
LASLHYCKSNKSKRAFEVLAPQGRVLAVYGRPAVLGCRYSVDPESPLDRLVLTWQREDNADVLHSFYYGEDQLERQSPRYRNRTSLFASELLSGNASLRLDPVRPQDVGTYLCFVSNLGGTGKAAVHLSFAGYYTEPRLSIELRSTSATFLYESEGFPEPLVNWQNWEGRNISHFTEVVQQPSEDGLFSLRSQIEVDSAAGANYTFILENQILSQVITRNVCLRTGGKDGQFSPPFQWLYFYILDAFSFST